MPTAQRYNKLTRQMMVEEKKSYPNFKKLEKLQKQMDKLTYKIDNSPKLQEQYELENACEWEGV